MKRAGLVAASAAALALVLAASAAAAIYRGAGSDDPGMPVKVTLQGRDVSFRYSDVLVNCSDGSRVRQGGAVHSGRLNSEGRFKDTLEVEGDDDSTIDLTTSVVKGRVKGKKAWGSVVYELDYEGGDCHSGTVKWSARRR